MPLADYLPKFLRRTEQKIEEKLKSEQDPEVMGYTEMIRAEDLNKAVRLFEADYDDPDQSDWSAVSTLIGSNAYFQQDILNVRYISRSNPYAIRALELARFYITTAGGPEVKLEPKKEVEVSADAVPKKDPLVEAACEAWEEWEEENLWYSHDENITRDWRDGELHFWYQRDKGKIRYVDPENLRNELGDFEAAIETEPMDVVDVKNYVLTIENKDPATVSVNQFVKIADVAPEDYLFVKRGTDSHEKRGASRFCVPKKFRDTERLTDNETELRIAQSSITKITTTQGGASSVRTVLDATRTANSAPNDNISQRHKNRPGTEQVVSKGTEVKYTHPDNNFSDAGPLIALNIKQIAAMTGWSYAQLSCDSSEGNLASMTISEGPVAEMVRSERCRYEKHLKKLYRWILELKGVDVDWSKYEICFEFPQLQSMEPLKQAQIVTSGVMNETMSRKTGRILQNLDPDGEEEQIRTEKASGIYNAGFNNQMGGADNLKQSASQNAGAAGSNQGQLPDNQISAKN